MLELAAFSRVYWYRPRLFQHLIILIHFGTVYSCLLFLYVYLPFFFGTYLCQFGNAHSVLSAEVFENGPGELIVRWTSEWR